VKHLSWIITLPITIVAVVFALSNRQPVVIDIWPLELSLTAPLYLMLLLAALVGFILGGIAMWFTAGRSRKRAREAAAKLREMEGQIANLKRSEQLRSAANDSVAQGPGGGQARLTSARG
jgi:uncharacterized integral membrane protein